QTLQVDPIYIDGAAVFEVQGGSPGATAIICYSMNGMGPFTLGNGITLDLSMPINNLRPFILNSLGNGALGPFPVPSSAVIGLQLWFQGVQLDMWATPIYSVTNVVPITVQQPAPILVSWGRNSIGQVSDTPTTNGFAQVAGGYSYSVALKADGTLVSWGNDSFGQVSNTPTTNDFTQVSAGLSNSVALKQ
ncbi:MAG: RCC1 domain-containing protein, partial [Planctomycetota bacterium]|nr:RCC1 domain-containing protein [Planctomycetota bacterium]